MADEGYLHLQYPPSMTSSRDETPPTPEVVYYVTYGKEKVMSSIALHLPHVESRLTLLPVPASPPEFH